VTHPSNQSAARPRPTPAVESRKRVSGTHARQVASGSRKQRAINRLELRPPDLAAQNLKLMAEHQQLDVLDLRATAAANEQTEQSPNSEVEEGEEHAAILAAAA
jgi:hypothetical protein